MIFTDLSVLDGLLTVMCTLFCIRHSSEISHVGPSYEAAKDINFTLATKTVSSF